MSAPHTVQPPELSASESSLAGGELGLADYLGILWRRGVTIVGIALVCGIAAFFVSGLTTPTYEGSVLLSVRPSKLSGDPNVLGAIASFRTLMENRALARATIDELGLGRRASPLTPDAFLSRNLSIDEVPRTNFVRLRVRIDDPQLAAKAANLVAERAVELNRRISDQEDVATRDFIKRQLDEVSARVSRLREELVEYRRGGGVDSRRGRLRVGTVQQRDAELARREMEYDLAANMYLEIAGRYENARIHALARSPELTIVDPAIAPERPVAPRPRLNAAVAMALGLILASAGVVTYNRESRRR